ncbi:MAG: hypothetical protein L6R30_19500 [Thermoanaerobaculia bacterium]|nr:hypothetical protein [Thermoanaerobaculia bacterium]
MPKGSRAVVIGGSMAGQLTARVLSDHFGEVVLVERDKLNDVAEARRGQPQARHLHGLLGKGLSLMTHYFPDLFEALKGEGAIPGDMGRDMLWYTNGGYRVRFESGVIGMMMSRPLLEWLIRRRVARIANVRVLDECEVKVPVATPDRSRVTGVRMQRRTPGGHEEVLDADLVVDASGRGSSSPKWLEALGYGAAGTTTGHRPTSRGSWSTPAASPRPTSTGC